MKSRGWQSSELSVGMKPPRAAGDGSRQAPVLGLLKLRLLVPRASCL
jgi:hypothetical protein